MTIRRPLLWMILFLIAARPAGAAELQAKTLAAWDTYVGLVEQRIERELADPQEFLAIDFRPEAEARAARSLLRTGQLDIHKITTTRHDGREIAAPDGMIHHWIGAAFIPGAHLDMVIPWAQDYDHHLGRFPEVIASKLISRQGDTFQIYYKLRRKKIITVYYNTEYSVTYRRPAPNRVYAASHSTKIAQLENPDTPQEREMPVGSDGGYLWRLNSYWRYEESDGGVYVECESVSLSRAVPFGFGWMIGSYVESVPRESLENTLTSIRKGVLTAMGSRQ